MQTLKTLEKLLDKNIIRKQLYHFKEEEHLNNDISNEKRCISLITALKR